MKLNKFLEAFKMPDYTVILKKFARLDMLLDRMRTLREIQFKDFSFNTEDLNGEELENKFAEVLKENFEDPNNIYNIDKFIVRHKDFRAPYLADVLIINIVKTDKHVTIYMKAIFTLSESRSIPIIEFQGFSTIRQERDKAVITNEVLSQALEKIYSNNFIVWIEDNDVARLSMEELEKINEIK